MAREHVLLVLALGVLGGCASDAAPEPDPTIFTRGAFVAIDEGSGTLTLVRTLDVLELPQETDLMVSTYLVAPASYDEARELARNHDLPVGLEFAFLGVQRVTALPHQVVWWRTLTAEEEARVP
jgi:hypothetical protein